MRHGPTHVDGLVGWTDVPADLSDTKAISRLNAHLPHDAVIVSSDLTRCITTADCLSDGRERLPHEEELREIHFGDWETKTFSEVSASHPELSKAYWTTPGPVAPPNGESWDQAKRRVSTAVDRLADRFSGRDIIVVAHFAVILTQVQRAANMTPSSAISFKIDNLSVTNIEHMGSAWRVLGVNHKP